MSVRWTHHFFWDPRGKSPKWAMVSIALNYHMECPPFYKMIFGNGWWCWNAFWNWKKQRNVGSPAQVGLQREAFRGAQATTLGAVSSIWCGGLIPYGGFLSHGVPPVIIHFFIGFSIPKPWGYNKSSIFLRIFREKTIQLLGYPHDFETVRAPARSGNLHRHPVRGQGREFFGTHSKKRRSVRHVGKACWIVLISFGESVWWIHSYGNNTCWWFGTWCLWLSICWECHHPNWLSLHHSSEW